MFGAFSFVLHATVLDAGARPATPGAGVVPVKAVVTLQKDSEQLKHAGPRDGC